MPDLFCKKILTHRRINPVNFSDENDRLYWTYEAVEIVRTENNRVKIINRTGIERMFEKEAKKDFNYL